MMTKIREHKNKDCIVCGRHILNRTVRATRCKTCDLINKRVRDRVKTFERNLKDCFKCYNVTLEYVIKKKMKELIVNDENERRDIKRQ